MKPWIERTGLAGAVALLGLTVLNASWLAAEPNGGPKLIAHHGVSQLSVADGDCTAAQIEQPVHDYLENTARSMLMAQRLGAQMVEMDIAPTSDGQVALFGDATLDCRTDGSGDPRKFAMDDLRALDIGHGYTADGSKTFPLRGKGVGAMPTVEEALAALPRTPALFHLAADDPTEADVLAAHLRAAGRDVANRGDGFYGAPQPVARMAALYPEAWAWDIASGRECASDYVLIGWSGYLPQSCRGGTMIIPLNRQWQFWGWPNRLIARMEAHGGRVLVVAPGDGDAPAGLTLPEQLTEIPDSYNGYIWVEDIWTLGPALRPSQERRTVQQQLDAEEGLERRRAQ